MRMRFVKNSLMLNEDHKTVGLKLGRIGLVIIDYNTNVAIPDALAAEIFGLAPGEPIVRDTFHERIHPDDQAEIIALVDDLIAADNRDMIEFTHRIIATDGEIRWVHARKQLYREQTVLGGQQATAVAAVQDITERKRTEESTQYLMRELQHRTLNVTAITSAIARMVFDAGPPESFLDRFEPRIRNLVENMRIESRGEGIDLRRALNIALSPYYDPARHHVTITGETVVLDGQQSQTLAMVFHELATNSLKYGALGKQGLALRVSWKRDEAGTVLLKWAETRQEPAPSSRRAGFGTQILEDFAAMALHGMSRQHFDDLTYTYHLSFPVRGKADDRDKQVAQIARSA